MTDREKLIELIQSAVDGCATYWAGLIADHLIAKDVVVSVRCKDCEKWIDGLCFRYGMSNLLITRPDGYCDGGKRRTE